MAKSLQKRIKAVTIQIKLKSILPKTQMIGRKYDRVFSVVRDVLLWYVYSTVYLELRCICFYFWSILMNWRRKWQPTPICLPGEYRRWRSLVGYSPWGCKESDMTFHFHFHSYEYVLFLHYKDYKRSIDILFS